MGLLDGKVAIITGAGGGLGEAYAKLFAREGAAVVVNDLGGPRDGSGSDKSMAQQVVDAIKAEGGRAVANGADISTMAGGQSVFDDAIKNFGRADILVNNAGAYPFQDWDALDYAFWRRIQTLNLDSQFLMAKAIVPLMRRNRWGRIINITSNSVGLAFPGLTHYMASKMGVIGFTRGLASDLGGDGITVNALGPTASNGPSFQNGVADDVAEAASQMQSIKRVGGANDIVGAVQFLASDDAAFMTGQTIMVDGGLVRL